jgi:superfamily I DNA/RNA helicase
MAYDFLIHNPRECNALRSKLQQVILDEYQDVSVSQHKLLRLVVRGVGDEELEPDVVAGRHEKTQNALIPALLQNYPVKKARKEKVICYHVPKIICAGDYNQSIYGWRGAAPSLTVDGFRKDFPQGA